MNENTIDEIAATVQQLKAAIRACPEDDTQQLEKLAGFIARVEELVAID